MARHISLSTLSSNSRRRLSTHSKAADFFYKRSASPGNPRDQVALGSNFIEARFHLLAAERNSEYETLAGVYRRLLLANYSKLDSLPTDPLGREAMLRTLSAVLDDDLAGYGRIRGYLAELLVQRRESGDLERALRQAVLATRETRDARVWLLRADLTAKLESARNLLTVGAQALEHLPSNEARRQVSIRVANLLGETGSDSLAFEIINEALSVLPNEHKVPLYTTAGYLLHRSNRAAEAVRLLKAGYEEVGSKAPRSYRLFEEAAFLAFQIRDVRLLNDLRTMIIKDGLNAYQPVLCEILSMQVEGRYRDAALLGEGYPQYFALAAQSAFSWLVEGDVSRADRVLRSSRYSPNRANAWLRGLIALCQSSMDVYTECMRSCGFDAARPVDARTWVEVWDKVPAELAIYPSFYFPALPARLTGLDTDLRKLGRELGLTGSLAELPLSLPMSEVEPAAESQSNNGAGAQVIVHVSQSSGETSMSQYNNYGQTGSFGDNASASDFSLAQNAPQVHLTATDLKSLHSALLQESDASEHSLAIEQVELAVTAAEAGDPKSVSSHLRGAGSWVLSKASELGYQLVSAAIKHELGMQ